MACVGAQMFVLLFLFPQALMVDAETLSMIINTLQATYGFDHQFALAINVPDQYCNPDVPLDWNFLKDDRNGALVRGRMNGGERIYFGRQLIGAKPKPIPGMNAYYHSEYLLLIRSMSPALAQYDPLMVNLLNSNPKGCTIFYTFNSPCVRTCSTPNGPFSIINALNMFTNHAGPKAFVFNQIWHHDENTPQWRDNIKHINDRVPIYRCDANGCTRCVNNNNVVVARCLAN